MDFAAALVGGCLLATVPDIHTLSAAAAASTVKGEGYDSTSDLSRMMLSD